MHLSCSRSGCSAKNHAAETSHLQFIRKGEVTMDDVPLCPPWWPKILWDLHFFPRPPGPGPINLPVALEDVMASLTVHTMSYLMLDQQAGQQIRNLAEEARVKTT